jgi:hypothetical protein
MSGGGGLMQLVAYGAQDIYLTGQPQITFFKSVYRRHTNFAIESIIQTPNAIVFDNVTTVTISRSGDLLKKIWIEYSPYNLLSGVDDNIVGSNIGHSLLEQIEIEIGGQIIDRHYGRWLTIWNYLTESNPTGTQGTISTNSLGPGENDSSVLPDVSRPTRYNRMAYTHRGNLNVVNNSQAPKYAYIPLQFWFCKNPGLALPLIALQYHEVKLVIRLGTYAGITNAVQTGIELNGFSVYADYIYLDTTERRQFAQNQHEYLIEQLQRKVSQNQNNIKLTFVNPVKEIIICGTANNPYQLKQMIPANTSTIYVPNQITTPSNTTGMEWLYTLGPPINQAGYGRLYYNKPWIYSSSGVGTPNPIVVSNRPYLYNFGGYNEELNDNISRTNVTMKLVINGKDQFSARNLKYFTRKTVWETHSGIGSGNWGRIAVIPFNLYPDQYQPSGCVNFSVIADARLIFDKFDSTIQEQLNPLDIYALSYNILKITSGMGGVIFS